MSSSHVPVPGKSSGWSNLFSGAVASLESRLDTLLADDELASRSSRPVEDVSQSTKATKLARPDSPLAKSEKSTSRRSSPRGRLNGRFQDRSTNVVFKGRNGLGQPSLEESPRDPVKADVDKPTSNCLLEPKYSPANDISQKEHVNESRTVGDHPDFTHTGNLIGDQPLPRRSQDSSTSQRVDTSFPNTATATTTDTTTKTTTIPPTHSRTPSSYEAELSIFRKQDADQRTELHAHLELIETLQSKLSHFISQYTSHVEQVRSTEPPETMEVKIAEKDGRILTLLSESSKLSAVEVGSLSTIRNLNVRIAEEEKTSGTLKQKLLRVEKISMENAEKARRAEATEKAIAAKLHIAEHLENEVEVLKAEKDASKNTISDLTNQLADLNKVADELKEKAQCRVYETDKKVIAELRDQLEDAQINRVLAADKADAVIKVLKEEFTRQTDKMKVVETELRTEVSNLESKLELLRTRAEEATSSVTSDSQAMLLRQIDTLQTQYAVAKHNWQGIEGILTSRISSIEKERDEAVKRESDILRSARSAASVSRDLEDKLENALHRVETGESEIEELNKRVQDLRNRLQVSETTLQDKRMDFEREKSSWNSTTEKRIQDECMKWQANSHCITPITTEPQQFGPDSPYSNSSPCRKKNTGQILTLQTRPTRSRNALRDYSGSNHRPLSRNTSMPQSHTLDLITSFPYDDLIPPSLNSRPVSATPSMNLPDNAVSESKEILAPITPSSSHLAVADLLSTTAGAGPSVQIMERMSAAVRRLEGERAVSREEIDRLTKQRDEARAEVISHMMEVEDKRRLQTKTEELEERLKETDGRYAVALEMLGEKTEKVEELNSDMVDLKMVYRKLAEEFTKDKSGDRTEGK